MELHRTVEHHGYPTRMGRRRASRLRSIGSTLVLLWGLAVLLGSATAGAAEDQSPTSLEARGRYLLAMAGCVACHTVDRPLAGGRAIESPFGTFFSPNITPHMRHGIGAWSDEQFLRALHQGISPSGRHYYPAFPYTSFSRMTRKDILALRAYLMTRPTSPRTNQPHDIGWPVSSQKLLKLWKNRKSKSANKNKNLP